MADTSALPPTDEPSDRDAVEADVRAAGSDLTALDELRARYQLRLSRHSDDFAATHGLVLVERALRDLGHGADPWDEAVRKLLR